MAYLIGALEARVAPGPTRLSSLQNAFAALDSPKKDDIILVHNGANPLPSHEEISQCLEKLRKLVQCLCTHCMLRWAKQIDM